ncbi:DNA 3'-5' helicase OS=Tsukamurella paurometabola (strain ATCC 8368 / DSM / CCUG 35730 / CIP 100753 / JCM 10117 / KCTC 9821 / NBRC 16120 / NCIMB 702349 /NCTC 13040) OX=521096 GN=Tpau_1132 PE=3 SV=1 [Tsukamurella paurometabola]|uniref:DNA 3'-5' helicase n=1 Tax=Tsukamurella paurometabola (strain ATCC 8368 / DSM 20162 / CCUG 35730 / CIP 100753 / JCM 10117 / KCTC 9821 / NBRC 16120 / NCIMB 702349 / NCTC 13040) TaxID=521096 RepID=D5UVV7_TSUPD|nr:ATP-dependent DNA helicase [Tsukamurella paurometabola]ADG77764.1 UvrD/REP helicase [Tsukamurella paurometabola DSM 20162]SUP28669.1 ATP-dependent DNA helicase pcrA [Tsukamurella paurometabola]
MTEPMPQDFPHAPLISAEDLAYELGQAFAPTQEQRAVIEAPLGPCLVVAGAGAGKTETMAGRVVWLIANRYVTPDQVLGLTFTRKAAQQLMIRVRKRLSRLGAAPALERIDPSGELRVLLRTVEPEISTYHAYAGRLHGDYGMLLPVEPTVRLVSETERWQIAFDVVTGWDEALETDKNPATLTEQVLGLSGALADHLVTPDQLEASDDELERLIGLLPPGPRQRAAPNAALLKAADVQEQRRALIPLVRAVAAEMRVREVLDFGSQMGLAAQLALANPDVAALERSRFGAVLLDEYQDTGHAQRMLLASLFGGPGGAAAVTAVGDPIQSIYGWRGASAANLPRFATDFPQADGMPAPRRELLTSWRNPTGALSLANAVSEDLRRRGVPVSELRARPDAPSGDLRIALHSTVIDERTWVADAITALWRGRLDAGDPPPTVAVLVRRNADSAGLAAALGERGVPVEVVGLGGLLHTPEVQDLVALLRLAVEPLAGTAAMRLLTGPRWQLGAADLRALWNRARRIAHGTGRAATGLVTTADELDQALDATLPAELLDAAGLGDAIADPGPDSDYSAAGLAKIRSLDREIRNVRERLGHPLPEVVAEAERVLGVSIETRIRAARQLGGRATGREHLDAFADVVVSYAERPTATLPGLLSFLAAAEAVEGGLTPGDVEVATDRVQVLTVHSAKGLEWDVVAVPHLSEGIFPSNRAMPTWLSTPAELPPELRGDVAEPGESDGVPRLDLSECNNRKDLEDALDTHRAALKAMNMHEDERLFYVAVTRTQGTLLLSGHYWSEDVKTAKAPSRFLDRAREHAPEAVGHWAATPVDDAENPLEAEPVQAPWPRDFLAAHRADADAGAALVLAALADPDGTEADARAPGEDPHGWAADVTALLAERARQAAMDLEVAVPREVSVSQLVELRRSPETFARRLRRPVPYRPNPYARRGTAFHAWLERRYGASRLLDFDELPGAADGDAGADENLALLQRRFEESEWAARTPVDIEVPFEIAAAGTVVRGRMDAVFRDPGGGFTVVDWKTGVRPSEPADERAAAVQLAAYRLAWARLRDVPVDEVRAAFFYVRSGETVSPSDLLDHAGLELLITSAGRSDLGE